MLAPCSSEMNKSTFKHADFSRQNCAELCCTTMLLLLMELSFNTDCQTSDLVLRCEAEKVVIFFCSTGCTHSAAQSESDEPPVFSALSLSKGRIN